MRSDAETSHSCALAPLSHEHGHHNGHYSWGTSPIKRLFALLPDGLQEEILPPRASPTDTQAVHGIIMPYTTSLLKTFDPSAWASDFEQRQRLVSRNKELYAVTSRPTTNGRPTATGLSTASSLPAFQKHEQSQDRVPLRDREGIDAADYDWDATEAKIVAAITKSWKANPASPMTNVPAGRSAQIRSLSCAFTSDSDSETSRRNSVGPAEYRDWDLSASLLRDSTLTFGEGLEERPVQCRKLADLLKLRALFLLAYLMIGPDSSDVYLADGSEVEMPIR
ncbi:uncharacterized protein BDZ99DRAFT_479526 [Mytilinidion resinicola]|uniref:Uncharacterized protein n=1 Tax=Mytilinidion resinicola TaxID=574789 RepID=A0A6A6YEI3_9PEZI|nr:uncharacterized protein BDZ99DRAFT_479526 [Mytilinidion resinicola]KAF2806257.1 hypothetical protein BDZ99DRAFT_479526 [Mytilinidion resinicola]